MNKSKQIMSIITAALLVAQLFPANTLAYRGDAGDGANAAEESALIAEEACSSGITEGETEALFPAGDAEGWKKTGANTKFGTDGITNPASGAGGWCYVYYGTCDKEYTITTGVKTEKKTIGPVKYRVLDKETDEFNYTTFKGKTMLLNSEKVLYKAIFDDSNGSYDWDHCSLRTSLDNDFTAGFTKSELDAVTRSYKTAKAERDGNGWSGLEGDMGISWSNKIFLLDAGEATRVSYGFADNSAYENVEGHTCPGSADDTREKKSVDIKNGENVPATWWLRNTSRPKNSLVYYAGYLGTDGSLNRGEQKKSSDMQGVSPAFNVDLSKILFTSLTSLGTSSGAGAVYKLTMKNPVNDPDTEGFMGAGYVYGEAIQRIGNSVVIPWNAGGNPNRISILITDKAYDAGDAVIRLYDSIAEPAEGEDEGVGGFTIPSGFKSTDKVYVIGEIATDEMHTDTAGEPQLVNAAIPTAVTPSSKVYFDPNGTEATVDTEYSTTGTNGKLASLPTPVNTGFGFEGWFTLPKGGELITKDTVFYTEATVYAHWTRNPHRVDFNANGGKPLVPGYGTTGEDGKLKSLPTPEYDHFDFMGWYTEADGGEPVTEGTVFSGDAEIYAHWSYTEYTVTFNPNAEGATVDPGSGKTGEGWVLASLPKPVLEKYDFEGWFTLAEGGNLVTKDTQFKKDTEIFAHWHLHTPVLCGKHAYRTGEATASVRFYSDCAGRYYYIVSESEEIGSKEDIIDDPDVETGTIDKASIIYIENPKGLGKGARYLHTVLVGDESGFTSDILTIPMPFEGYYFDDFEAYEVGTYVNQSGNPMSPISQDHNGSGNENQKVAERPDGNGKMLSLESSKQNDAWASDQVVSLSGMVSETGNGTYRLEGDVCQPDGYSEGYKLVFGLSGSIASGIRFSGDGIYLNSSNAQTKGEKLHDAVPGEWYHVRIDYQYPEKAMSVWINGEKVVTDEDSGNCFSHIWLSPGNRGNVHQCYRALYDNIGFTFIPESEDPPGPDDPVTINPVIEMEGWTYGDEPHSPTLTEGSNPGNGTVTWRYKVKGEPDSTYAKEVPENAGEYTVKAEVAASGNYSSGTAEKDFTIGRRPVTGAVIVLSGNTFVFNGMKQTVSVSKVTLEGKDLTPDKDYSVSGTLEAVEKGDYKVTVTGQGNYKDSVDSYWHIIGEEDHIVHFNARGGSLDMEEKSVTTGEAYGDLPTPAREGYRFDGWFAEDYEAEKYVKVEEDTDYWHSDYYLLRISPLADWDNGGHFMNGNVLGFDVTFEGAKPVRADINDCDTTGDPLVEGTDYAITGNSISGRVVLNGNHNLNRYTFLDINFTAESADFDHTIHYFRVFDSNDGLVTKDTVVSASSDHTLYAGWYKLGSKSDEGKNGIYFVDDDGNETTSYSTTFTGTAIKPEVRVYDNGRLLSADRDYSLSYKNNKNAYTLMPEKEGFNAKKAPLAAVKLKGKYAGKHEAYFVINPVDIADVDGSDMSAAYTGKPQLPKVVLTYGKLKLKSPKDFSFVCDPAECTEPGSYKVVITGAAGKTIGASGGTGDFYGTRNLSFTIAKEGSVPVSKLKIMLDKKSYAFSGSQIKPQVTINGLTEGTDYSLTYGENKAVGTGYVKITGKGSYEGSRTEYFAITGISMKKVKIQSAPEDKTFTGKEQVQTGYSLTDPAGTVLVEGKHYSVSYLNNLNAGKAAIVFTGIPKNGCEGTLVKNFKILPRSINDEGISIQGYMSVPFVAGGAVPVPRVTCDGKDLIEGVDFTLKYNGNKAVSEKIPEVCAAGGESEADSTGDEDIIAAGAVAGAQPTYTVTGIGNFTGASAPVSFSINRASLSGGTVFVYAPDLAYSNKSNNFKQKVRLIGADGKVLTEKKDYTLKYYLGNISEGNEIEDKATVPEGSVIKVKAIAMEGGNYTDSITASFKLVNKDAVKDISKAKVVVPPQEHTGNPVTLESSGITVTLNGGSLTLLGSSDPDNRDGYKIVSYHNNVSQGSAVAILKGCGTVSGVKAVKFRIGKDVISTVEKVSEPLEK